MCVHQGLANHSPWTKSSPVLWGQESLFIHTLSVLLSWRRSRDCKGRNLKVLTIWPFQKKCADSCFRVPHAVFTPADSVVKNPPANAGDVSSILGSGRSLGGGRKWQPTQYSFLENPTDKGAWQAIVHGSQSVGHDWACIHTCCINHLSLSNRYPQNPVA